MDHTIIITPAFRRDGSRCPDRFVAQLDGGSTLCTSAEPLLASARKLLSLGIANPEDTILMRHAGSNHVALRSRVGLAAKLTTRETRRRPLRFAKWRGRDAAPTQAKLKGSGAAGSIGFSALGIAAGAEH